MCVCKDIRLGVSLLTALPRAAAQGNLATAVLSESRAGDELQRYMKRDRATFKCKSKWPWEDGHTVTRAWSLVRHQVIQLDSSTHNAIRFAAGNAAAQIRLAYRTTPTQSIVPQQGPCLQNGNLERMIRSPCCPASLSRPSLETHNPAKKCYSKAGFREHHSTSSTFPSCACIDSQCSDMKIEWFHLETGAV